MLNRATFLAVLGSLWCTLEVIATEAGEAAPIAVEFVEQWGKRGEGDGDFNCPGGIAVTAEGRVYVVDAYNHRVQKFRVAR